MKFAFVAALGACGAALADASDARGFPLLFCSFEHVGNKRVDRQIVSVDEADQQLTQWTKGCPADVFLVVRDHGSFDLNGLKRLQRATENSMTYGSLLTAEKPVDLRELALDLQDYCEAEFIELTENVDLTTIENISDTRTRVYFVDLADHATPEKENAVLSRVFEVIPSPFVTVIYTSDVLQREPVLRSIQMNPSRRDWQRQRHSRDHIVPVIAPLFNKKKTGHSAPEPAVGLPDNFFLTLGIGSILFSLFLAYRDWWPRSPAQKAPVREEKE